MDMKANCIRLERNQTKTKAPRVIYMRGDFLKVIEKAKEVRDGGHHCCPWVVHISGQPIKNFIHGWKALMKRIGLQGLLFHDLRRTGVRNLGRAGVPETVEMKISGHKTRSVFDRYNITSEEDLQVAAERLDQYIQRTKQMVIVAATVAVEESSAIQSSGQSYASCGKYGGGGEI